MNLSRTAGFVRGFFRYLDTRVISNAVLHGGEDCFEQNLSDVDFVVDLQTYPNLAGIIDDYCEQAGWQLCQVLRHETTAAFYVCSAVDDPTCAVALDACSDYQRNGTLFLTAEELLEDRRELPWGGHGLNPTTELRYRFAKAAAKNKDSLACEAEFARYPEEIRRDCAAWLDQRWEITLTSWDLPGLTLALRQFTAKANTRPSLFHLGTLSRILFRIINPTGLIVITGHTSHDASTTRLKKAFGHLYFRTSRRAESFRPTDIKRLIASTLILVPELGFPWTKILPANWLHRLDPALNPEGQCKELAKHLHQRCKRREKR